MIDSEKYRWLDPSDITGFDILRVRKNNELNWLHKESDIESEDEIIADYLFDCLIEQNLSKLEGEKVSAIMLVKAVVFLVCQLGSSYSANTLVCFRNLLNVENSNSCLELLGTAFRESQGFVKDIMRDFILDFFCYGSQWGDIQNDILLSLTEPQRSFLKSIQEHGYVTINKNP